MPRSTRCRAIASHLKILSIVLPFGGIVAFLRELYVGLAVVGDTLCGT
jgi:hypothetical protein